jgi:hypothetical protein
MTFRDDHDAALARADALEGEVARTKEERDQLAAERDELAAKVKQLEAERPRTEKVKQRAKPEQASPASSAVKARKVFMVVGIIAVIAAFVVPAIAVDCGRKHERDEWSARTEARNAHRKRWQALVSVEDCVRDAAFGAMQARRNTPDKADPRTQNLWFTGDRLLAHCTHGVKELAKDPKTAPTVRDALYAWLELQSLLAAPAKALAAYYSNRDWKEDNFAGAPALWAPVLGLLDRQVAAIAVIRRDVLPAIRVELRELQRAHFDVHGRDEAWWRAELGLMLFEINDRSYEVSGIYRGREPDDTAAALALREPVTAFVAASKQAPIEVRRIVRKLDWITEPIANGQPPRGETPLWHLANGERDLIGPGQDFVLAMPPDPGPQPRDHD